MLTDTVIGNLWRLQLAAAASSKVIDWVARRACRRALREAANDNFPRTPAPAASAYEPRLAA